MHGPGSHQIAPTGASPLQIMEQVQNCLLTKAISKQIAQGHIVALEKLIEAYVMIGEAMPRFDRLTEAFKSDPQFLQVMGYFYEDLLEFHRRAYRYFRRRGKPYYSLDIHVATLRWQ